MRILILFLLTTSVALGANKHVRQGAGGSANGLDWNNAYTSLPATLVRGDTYYVADGNSYPGYIANTANSGDTWIYIKKATIADHGSATGWDNSYGDGQAVFAGIKCFTDYWDWDGVTRNENDWTDADSYGFAVYTPKLNPVIGNFGESPNGDGDHWSIKYFSLGRTSFSAPSPRGDDFNTVYMANFPIEGWNISRCLHRFVPGPYMGTVVGFTNEYCHFTQHTAKTAIRGLGGSTDWYIRFNKFVDAGISYYDGSVNAQGQPVLATQTTLITGWGYPGMARWYIYGNWCHETGTAGDIHYSNAGLCQLGGLGHGEPAPSNLDNNGCRVHNNVFSQLGRAVPNSPVGLEIKGSDNEAHNNVWLLPNNGTYAYINATKASNNWILGSSAATVQSQWPTTLIGTADPFVNSSGMNFFPKDPNQVSNPDIINNGVLLPAPFNVDPLGNSRNSGGFADIGVYESDGLPPVDDTTPPSAPTGLVTTPVSQTQINISWNASTDNVAVGSYAVLRNQFQIAIVTALNYNDIGLSPSTTYTYNIQAIDTSNNFSTQSASDSETTLAPDSVAPSVPANLVATEQSSSSVYITWYVATDAVDPNPTYDLYRGVALVVSSLQFTNYTDTGLLPETTYTYTVKSRDSAGNISAASAGDNATTLEAPAFPTNNLVVWLRGDVGITTNSTDVVFRWADQSGYGKDATQTTIGAQPILLTNALGNHKAVFFGGVNQYLNFSLPINGNIGMTIFVVGANATNQFKGSSEAERAAIFWNESAGWGTAYVSPFQNEVNFRFGTTQVGNRFSYARPETITNLSITTAMKSNTVNYLRINGAQVLVQGGGLSQIAACVSPANIGRGYNDNTFYAGYIAEVLIYTNFLTKTELEAVETYLGDKYFAQGPDPDTEAPTVPANLAATAVSTTQINLTWSASTDNIAVDHYTVTNVGLAITYSISVGTHNYSVTGLTPNTSYSFKIMAVDTSMNMSAFSAADTESTLAIPAIVIQPLERLKVGPPSITY